MKRNYRELPPSRAASVRKSASINYPGVSIIERYRGEAIIPVVGVYATVADGRGRLTGQLPRRL
jgi:hypothetical protein